MINYSVFSPIGRIFTMFLEQAKKNNYTHVTLIIPAANYSQKLDVERGTNREVFDTTTQRSIVGQAKKVYGSVEFEDAIGNSVARDFVLHNCLLTDHPVRTKNFTYKGSTTYGEKTNLANGKHSVDDIQYPEALDVEYDLNFQREESSELTDDLRPLYAYKWCGLKDGVYTIFGPSPATFGKVIAKATYDDEEYRIICDEDLFSYITDDRGSLEDTADGGVKVLLRASGNSIPFVLTSRPFMLYDHPLQFDVSKQILLFAVYCEQMMHAGTINGIPGLDPSARTLTIDMERYGEYWYISPLQSDFYKRWVVSNSVCRYYNKILGVTEGNLFIKKGDSMYVIAWDNDVRSSFALALSYWLTLFGRNSYTEFIKSLETCIDEGLLSKSSEGDLHAGSELSNPRSFRISSSVSTIVLKDFGIVRTQLEKCNGYYLVGYDRDDDKVSGRPENYCVALIRNGAIVNTYDPYNVGNWKKSGDIITDLVKSGDFVIYSLPDSASTMVGSITTSTEQGGAYVG